LGSVVEDEAPAPLLLQFTLKRASKRPRARHDGRPVACRRGTDDGVVPTADDDDVANNRYVTSLFSHASTSGGGALPWQPPSPVAMETASRRRFVIIIDHLSG